MTLLKTQVIAKQKNKFLENDVALLQSKLYGMKPVIIKLLMPICLMFLFSLEHINAQCLTIPVLANFNNQGLIMNDTVYPLSDNHRIKFESFKFYMTNVVLVNNNQPVWIEDNSYHLVDFDDLDSNQLCLEIPDDLVFNAIKFTLGIDSATNASGVKGGDLDPTKGMYWTWQSGYINFKLEGTSNLCNNPKNQFEYHLGGYIPPYNNAQQVNLSVANPNKFKIIFKLDKFVNALNLSEVNHIMSPNQFAVIHARSAARCFEITND